MSDRRSKVEEENAHLFDLKGLVDQVIATGLDPSVFDVDLEVTFANNVIDFAVGPEYMNMTSLWSKQAEQAVRLFSDYCPECSDPDFLEDVPVDASIGTFRSKVVLLNHGICPECNKNRRELFDKLPWELVSCLGQRSGKTALTGGVITPYYLHRFLQYRNPARFYGLMANSFFEVTFVAVTAGQVKRGLWTAFKEAISQSPWFTDYSLKLRQVEKEKGFERGTLFKSMDSYIWFGNKHVGCSYAAADMKSLRGSTRIFCVTGDTIIATDHGLIQAKDVKNSPGIKFLTKSGEYKAVTASFEREADVLHIRTNCGYELSGSHDHPVLVANKDSSLVYKTLGTMNIGDVVVLSRAKSETLHRARLPEVPKNGPRGHNNRKYIPPKEMTPDLAYLLGILAAEGYLSKRVIRWHTSDKEILDKSVSAFESVFGSSPKIKPHGSLKEGWSPGWYIEAQSPILHKFLCEVGLSGKSDTKTVPWSILQSDSSCTSQFLAGYFDGDSNVEFYADSPKKSKAITVHSKSEDLLKKVQILLLSKGIVSHRSYYSRNTKGKLRKYHKLQIFGKNYAVFHKSVRLIDRKRGISVQEEYEDTDKLYVDLSILRTDSVNTNYALFYKRNTQNCVYATTLRDHLGTLKEQLDPGIYDNLSNMLSEDLFFDPIQEIASEPIQAVFDWTVEQEHNFVGNGIVQHNCGIDELGWFNATKEAVRANADETYAALSNSLRTVRSASDRLWKQGEYQTMPGIMANISSPSSQYDKMMALLKEGTRDKRKVCFHLSSWEASPLITRDSLETEEQNNPVVFWRDFGAVPPIADSPFIESTASIYEMRTNNKPLASWKPKFVKDKVDPTKNRYITAELLGSFSDNRVRMIPRVITVDCGETQNSFAIGVYHLEPASGEEGNRFNIVTDVIIEAKPEKIAETGEIIPVHFPSMFQIVKTLCDKNKGLHIKAALYDRWQSTGQIQELREMKIRAEKYTPKDADFKLLRSLVYSGNFKTPKWEHNELTDLDITDVNQIRLAPYTHMAVQFATVREVGMKVIKPEVGDDDLFRTSVLAAAYMTENMKDFLTKVAVGQSSTSVSVGSLALKSSVSNTYRGSRSRATIGSVKSKTSYYGRR